MSFKDRSSAIQNLNARYQNSRVIERPSFYQDNYEQKPVQQLNYEITPPTYNPVPDSYSTPEENRGVTYLGESMRKPSCPTWVWALIGLIVLGIVGWTVYHFCFAKKSNQIDPIVGQPLFSSNGAVVCANGFFLINGKCIACPNNSQWTGSVCQYLTNNQKQQFNPQDLAGFIQSIYRSRHNHHLRQWKI